MADPPSGSGRGKQVGIIDEERMKNLAICGAVILVVIFALVPNPRIAIWAPWRREVHLVHGDAGGGWGWG